MKGLLLKDFYMAWKYCKLYLFIAAFSIVMLFTEEGEDMFFIMYPCILCGLIPMTLLAYDERSRWVQYSAALPYTRGQIVSSKYLIGLMAQTAMALVIGLAQAVKTAMYGGFFQAGELLAAPLTALALTCALSSIILPFVFKLGVEKGRIVFYVMTGVMCGGSVVATDVFFSSPVGARTMMSIFPVFVCCGGLIYALSWYLSIIFYKKREL